MNARIDRLGVGADFGGNRTEKGGREFDLGFETCCGVYRRLVLGLLGLGNVEGNVFLFEFFTEDFGSNPCAASRGNRKGDLYVYA